MSGCRILVGLCVLAGCENLEESKLVVERQQAATKAYCACETDACRTTTKSELAAWEEAHAKKVEAMGREAKLAVADEMVARTKCMVEAPLELSDPAAPRSDDVLAEPELGREFDELEAEQGRLAQEARELSKQLDGAERAGLEAQRAALEAQAREEEER